VPFAVTQLNGSSLNMAENESKKRKAQSIKSGEGKKTPPTISACMMVKNEEELLPQCLESIKDVVDEIIIVDTGSKDGTVEIAKSYGAKVYQHPWENDFSKHRNQSIGYASGDWIFIIDADEELRGDSRDAVRAAIRDDGIDSVMVTVISYMNDHMSQGWINQVRLFRNNPGISYVGRVHNRLAGYTSSRAYAIYLYHYGYDLSLEKRREKFARTSSLLKKQIETEPDVYRHRHDLAACYLSNHMFEEAVVEGIRALEMARRNAHGQEALIPWTYFITAFAYLKLENLSNAEKYAHMALQAFTQHLDSYFILVNVYHETRDWNSLESVCSHYLNIVKALREDPARFGNIMQNTVNEEWRVHLALGDVYLERKLIKRASEEFDKAFSSTPNPSECHKIVGNFYSARASWELAKRHYRTALDMSAEYPDALLGLARVYKSVKKNDQYFDTINRLKKLESKDIEIIKEIGISDLRSGNYQSAIVHFKKILEQRPDDVDAHINLALAYKHEGSVKEAERHNLRALELKNDSVEALSNLGHLHYEATQYDKAKEMYVRAIQLEKNLVDVHVRLASLYLFDGEIENCVEACDSTLKTLKLPCSKTLNDIGELAEIFLLMSSGLKQNGKMHLSEEARQTGNLLRQMQSEESSAMRS